MQLVLKPWLETFYVIQQSSFMNLRLNCAVEICTLGIIIVIITHADDVGRRKYDFRVRLFVCLSVCLSAAQL